MVILAAIVVGTLFASGIYLLFRQSIAHLIIGLALLGHATNLFLFSMGGLERGAVPIIGSASGPMVDPVPQALILTAIVIGFGIQAFVLVLGYRAHEEVGTDSLDDLKATDTA
jgi:multicomponent Na+:H+ antiporter subunit C